ncbi:glycosyltransferase family 4 protein [Klebsiella pneumoniae]|uniref:glycosyltransferase family 4 protein n=1 Tax=Klebsiella pneumoniae TaxID=573 RepID=UPI001E37FFA4|nr:glycosyltransferase family 4 protein [Klebsiella pneumoniae]MCD1430067.1 glycosyltransferase family 4 protein [Klebsiella pneumoniae]MCD1435386.1 glycosyltransferase family 4 protein [Klebsiella pneumoniae]
MQKKIDVGIVADWFVTYAGSEKVVSDFIKIFPDSNLYSIVDFLSNENKKYFMDKKIETTFVQHLPKAKKQYQKYLPLMPFAVEQLDVTKHEVVLSSSHAVSKGVITGPDQLHISYIHSPIRYAWDLQHQYLRESGFDKGVKGFLAKWFLHKIRLWDVRTSNGVDHFIANSHFISRRIKKVYGRSSDVIYPPVDVESFNLMEDKDNYYLTASRLVPYKRVDLIVEAFGHMPEKKLLVIGDGPEMEKIKAKAKANVVILGYQSNEAMIEYMQRAKAFVFAAEEDFGITPVEAQSCGTPVIAFGKGGALETVRPYGVSNPTGVFFYNQTVTDIISAVETFEQKIDSFLPVKCRDNTLRFSSERFQLEIKKYIDSKWLIFNESKKIIY